jgi:type I restriction enzyme S subunit
MNSLASKPEWVPKPLIEVATLHRGYDLPVQDRTEGPHPIFAANGTVGFHGSAKCQGPGVVTGRSGTIGKVHFVEGDYWPLNTSLYVTDFHGNDPKWVYYMLQSFGLERFSQGAGVPTLNRNLVHGEPISVPPITEQRRIAAILDQAEALRTKRRAALAKLDTLAQTIFIKMFGDPVANPMQWPDTTPLGEVADIVSGITIGRNLEGLTTREVPYLAVVNVQDREIRLDVLKTTEATEVEIARFRLQKNDLLLTEGGDPDKLGRGSLWYGEVAECIHQNHVFRVRLTSRHVHPLFLNWLVGSRRGKSYFLKSAKQTTGIASINMTQLRGFPLLLPPMALQQRFAERVDAVDRLKHGQNDSLSHLDDLFASLQHRAFRGEL